MANKATSRVATTGRSAIFDTTGGQSVAFNTSSSDIKRVLLSHNIVDRYEDNMYYDKFNRFGIIDPYNALTNSKEFVFVTKPDLCLAVKNADSSIKPVNILENNTFFTDAIQRYPKVVEQLQSSLDENKPPFMIMLSNAMTSTIDMPGISADSIETGANVMGTKIAYRGTSYKSDENLDFSTEFEDTKNLDVYMLFKMYDEYERLKWNGNLDFTKLTSHLTSGSTGYGNKWTDYILNKVLHDQVSIYKFIVSDDGYRIIYWAKITGCYPVDIPRDAFSNVNNGDIMKLTVRWRGHFVRDMDPVILSQFNKLARNTRIKATQELPLYDSTNLMMDGRWATIPYIVHKSTSNRKGNGSGDYFLKWYIGREE